MNRSTFETMDLDDLWALHERVVEVLELKIETQKHELERRLADLDRRLSGPPIELPPRRHYPRVKPKFQNPEDPTQTWAGRGKLPRWMSALLKTGKSMEDFRISRM